MTLRSASKTVLMTSAALAFIGAAGLSGCSGNSAPKDAVTDAAQAAQTDEAAMAAQTAEDMSGIDSTVKMLTDAGLESDLAYKITESLTTEIGPRLAGSEAELRALDWGKAKFEELGFENVRIEPFTIKGWDRGEEKAAIVTPYPQQLYLTALGGSVSTPNGGITAEVAYFPTFDDLVAAPETGLDGKIVYVSGLMEKAPDGAGYGPANRKRRTGATEAAKRGAAAVIIRSVGTDSHRFPHTGQMRYADDVKKIPIAALSAPDADQLDRIFESGESVTVSLDLSTRDLGMITSGNVIGEIVGSEKPEEIVLIGGHIDSWDLGTGAVDDGAGIGITVAAAKLLMDSGLQPKRTIRVVMFGAEEVGLLGAFEYARKYEAELPNHIIASESDFGAGPVYEVRAGAGDENMAFSKMLQSQIAHLDVAMAPEGTPPSTGGPDIMPMNAKGVPALRLQQNGYDYFDLHHTPDDTFDKIDPEEMAQNVAAFTAFIWLASEHDGDMRDEPAASREAGQ